MSESKSNKSKNKAAALKYNSETDNAPVVIASGYGSIADKIIDIAEHNGIPVFRDDSAASLLCMLEVGNSIPPELYEVVAAIYCELLKTAAEIKNTDAKTDKNSNLNKIRQINSSRKDRRNQK